MSNRPLENSNTITQKIVNFQNDAMDLGEYLNLSIAGTEIPVEKRWNNISLSANYFSNHFVNLYQAQNDSNKNSTLTAEIKGNISFILNELLENAVKFNDDTSQYEISIQVQLHPDKLLFLVSNSLTSKNTQIYQSVINELHTKDPQELYYEQMEKSLMANVDEELSGQRSRLGLLTLINDYSAEIGWKFETMTTSKGELTVVTTMVKIEF
jgi:hypothetical protein